MKTISELQQEIRSIRSEMTKLDSRLEVLDSELVNYKDTPTEKSEYKRIFDIAKSMPIFKHPILKESLNVKNNYFAVLLMVITVDDSLSDEQLLFLQRMVMTDSRNSRLDHYLGSIIPGWNEIMIAKYRTELVQRLLACLAQ